MKVAIIEYESDIDEALKSFAPEDTVFLSVSAEASRFLMKKGLSFLTDEEMLSPEEFKDIGEKNFGTAAKMVAHLDEGLMKQSPLLRELNFHPFRWHFYRIKILLDAVSVRYELLERLFDREKPSVVGAPRAAVPEKIRDHHLFFYKDESLYGLLAAEIAAQRGIELKVWKSPDGATPGEKIKNGIYSVAAYLKGISGIISKMRNLRGERREAWNFLFGSISYDIQPLLLKLGSRINAYYYQAPCRILSLGKLRREKPASCEVSCPPIDTDSLFLNLKIFPNPILDTILKKRIKSYADNYIKLLFQGWRQLADIDSRLNFRAFVHISGAGDAFQALPIAYFSAVSKPVIVVQHGGYGFALNRYTEYSEFGHNGTFFAWGDGVREMYDGRKKGDCRIVSTGSHIIENIVARRKKKADRIKNVCYVPISTYSGYTTYFPNGQPCLDSRLFIQQAAFLSALKPYHEQYSITFKAGPGSRRGSNIYGKNPMFDWLKNDMPYVKIDESPFLSVINEHELYIIDWPTTTLVQALASGAEVLVYAGNPYHELTGTALELLKQRAVVGLNEEDFKNKIRMVLDGGKVVSDIDDMAFLEKYGVHKNDGKALERMYNHTMELCSKN